MKEPAESSLSYADLDRLACEQVRDTEKLAPEAVFHIQQFIKERKTDENSHSLD